MITSDLYERQPERHCVVQRYVDRCQDMTGKKECSNNHFPKLQKKYDIVWHCKHVFIVCTVTFIYKKSIQSISRLCKRTAVLKYRPMTATPVDKATIPRLLFLPLKKRARELYKRNTGSNNSHSPGCLLQHTVGNTPAQWTGAELWEITTTTKKSIPPQHSLTLFTSPD